MARRLFYISAALLCLSLAFHFGYTTARAQAPGNPVVATNGNIVFTANGDIYSSGGLVQPYVLVGNVFAGNPTPAQRASWAEVKARYRGNPVSTAPTKTDR